MNIWGGLPANREEVESVINRTSVNFSLKNDEGEVTFLDTRKSELIDLRNTLESSEMSFFKDVLKLSSGSPASCLRELKNRIDQLCSINAAFSIESIQQRFLSDPQVISSLDKITTEAVNNALSSITWTFEDQVGITEKDVEGDIIQYFSDMIQTKSASTGRATGYFADLEGQGLRRILKIERITDENEYFHIEIKAGERVSTDLKQKLLEVIRKYTKTKQAETKGEFQLLVRNKFNDLLQEAGSGNNILVQCLSYEINKNVENYDLNRSLSSLKGFLEEVWVNAVVSAVCGGPGQTLPTGNIRQLVGSRSEIPVDMVLRGYNFQIKSYTLRGGQYETLEKGKMIGDFIQNRAQMSGSELLIQFFGTYQFNQPFKGSEWNQESVQRYANEVYSNFDVSPGTWEPIFNSYVDRIIRIDNVFQGDREPFMNEQLYYNTFFMINSDPVPASVMVQCIIDSMEEQQDKDLIRLSVEDISSPDSGGTTFEQIVAGGKRNKRYSGSTISVANLIKISYKITYNFDEIINRAYARVQAYNF